MHPILDKPSMEKIINPTLLCGRTISQRHIWAELVLYNLETRLKNPQEGRKESFKYYKCFACGMIDDTNEK